MYPFIHLYRNLCDSENSGKLNQEQFALAMYLISERVKGRELPSELPPHMIPPSKRKGISPPTAAVMGEPPRQLGNYYRNKWI